MKRRTEDGMTILEVVIAISLLLIGAGFIAHSDAVSFHYLRQQELRQQGVFFAAGAMEAALEKKDLNDISSNGFTASEDVEDVTDFEGLKMIKVTVKLPDSTSDDIVMYNYRYQP